MIIFILVQQTICAADCLTTILAKFRQPKRAVHLNLDITRLTLKKAKLVIGKHHSKKTAELWLNSKDALQTVCNKGISVGAYPDSNRN